MSDRTTDQTHPSRDESTGAASTEAEFIARAIQRQAEAVAKLADADPSAMSRAVALVVECADAGGTVLVSGVGKSGLIGAKISATLASLGIPSHSVHPTEAAHGDLGRFGPKDLCLALSYSGETDEVVNLAGILKQDGLPIIAIAKGSDASQSSLERLATVTLAIGPVTEGGEPEHRAPTSSTAATLALGDVLALAAARRRRFTSEDFAKRHPGGALGGQLRPVVEMLRFKVGVDIEPVPEAVPVADALVHAAARSGRRPGAMLVVDDTGSLSGIFTDGDLRRLVVKEPADLDRPIGELMTRTPRTLPDSAVLRDAVQLVREIRADEIPVVDADGKPVGILDVQDLITLRLVTDEPR